MGAAHASARESAASKWCAASFISLCAGIEFAEEAVGSELRERLAWLRRVRESGRCMFV